MNQPSLRYFYDAHRQIEERARSFRPFPGVPGLYRPDEPIQTADLFEGPCDVPWTEDSHASGFPWQLPYSSLLFLGWEHCAPGCNGCYGACGLMLPGGTLVYLEHSDFFGERILAASWGVPPDDADAAFLTELIRTNGTAFGTGLMDDAPDTISVHPLVRPRRDELVWEMFCAAASDFGSAWEGLGYMAERESWYSLDPDEVEPGDPDYDPDRVWADPSTQEGRERLFHRYLRDKLGQASS